MAQKPNAAVPSSMLEGLQMILGELGGMMATPDADVNFLTTLQHAIVGKIKQHTQQAIQGQQQQTAQAMGMGGGPGGPGGPGGGGGLGGLVNQSALQQAQGGGAPGGPGGAPAGMPNPDELRRMVGANGVTG